MIPGWKRQQISKCKEFKKDNESTGICIWIYIYLYVYIPSFVMYVIQNLNKFHWIRSIYHEKDTGILIYFTIVIMIKLYKHDQVNKKIINELTRNIKLLGTNLCFNNHEECYAYVF